jgi:ankyrin repeat protein
VEAGADPELGVEHNYPILTAIVNSGDNALSAIELMLNKVTNINKQYVQGNTILHCAVDVQATKVVKLLLEKNADFNIRNDVGETAKEMAKFKGKSIKEQFFAP